MAEPELVCAPEAEGDAVTLKLFARELLPRTETEAAAEAELAADAEAQGVDDPDTE